MDSNEARYLAKLVVKDHKNNIANLIENCDSKAESNQKKEK